MSIYHNQESPFPYHSPRGLVVDEACYCGHKRSHHFDTIAFGHGECRHCDCNKFTWREFTLAQHDDINH